MSDYEKYLFRGKRKDNGGWVEGFYGINTICTEQDTYLSTVISKIPKRIYDYESWEVDPGTVGQYTGENDQNRTKIFEGDICEVIEWDYNGKDSCHLCEVCFDCGQFYFLDIKNKEDVFIFWQISDFDSDVKIVGNIYDNPELLGGENNGNN